jgi:hypothetical protein
MIISAARISSPAAAVGLVDKSLVDKKILPLRLSSVREFPSAGVERYGWKKFQGLNYNPG